MKTRPVGALFCATYAGHLSLAPTRAEAMREVLQAVIQERLNIKAPTHKNIKVTP